MSDYFSSSQAKSTILGVFLGVCFIVACGFNEKLSTLSGFAMFVIGLLGVHVAGEHLVDHKNAGMPPVQTPAQGETK